jgi:GH25 family lysozyme M1 (1,4-beta-N-acetylmuramidase)
VLTLTRAPSRPALLPIALTALLAAAALFAATSLAAPAPTLAASYKQAACDGVALRTKPKTSATRKALLSEGAQVTAVSTVTGGWWKVTCNGRTVSGNTWYRISAVKGQWVTARYGVSYVYGATALFVKATPVTRYAGCNDVALYTKPSRSATRKALLPKGAKVVAVALVAGGSWSRTCSGAYRSGSSWYRISIVKGESVTSRYGVSYVYGGSGLFTSSAPTTSSNPTPAPTPAPTTSNAEGIDVSHWQGTIDWARVRAAGKRFAFIKASENTSFVDDRYQWNRAQAKAAGLYVGAYHFAKPSSASGDAVAEADHFVDTADWTSGELLPVLDLEDTGGLGSSALVTWVRTFLTRVYDRTGERAIIYVSPSFWSTKMANSTWFAKNGYGVLWIAHWTTASSPSVPAESWGGKGWTFWQYTSDGSVSGISGRVDLNRYKGTDFSRVRIP